MRARQESVARMRLRITEAVVFLHEHVGPRSTTVSAVAEQAGVTRLTVYRHFPDEASLVGACAAHWSRSHPRPDPEKWSTIDDPVQRLRTALAQTYAWSGEAAPMMSNIYRDLDTLPDFVGHFLAADEQARVVVLRRGFPTRGAGGRRLDAALAHALKWRTWESLCADARLTEQEAITIMVGAVMAAHSPQAAPRH